MCVCTRACDGIGNRVACLCVCTRVCMGASMGLCMQAATHSYQVNLNCSPRYRESYRYISVVLLCIGCVISQPALSGVISFVSSLSHRYTMRSNGVEKSKRLVSKRTATCAPSHRWTRVIHAHEPRNLQKCVRNDAWGVDFEPRNLQKCVRNDTWTAPGGGVGSVWC